MAVWWHVQHLTKFTIRVKGLRGNFTATKDNNMIISIARQCGSGGLIIAELLSKHYGIPFYTIKKLEDMAEAKGIKDEMSDFFAEYPVNALLYAITQSDGMGHVTDQTRESLQSLVGDNDCIIVGRCGNYVFRNRADLVSVFLKGDRESRIKFMAEYKSISPAAAEELVDGKDESRRAYHNYYTGETWGDADKYDLCVDSNKLGFENAAHIIEWYADNVLKGKTSAR